jgi:hypothetical protein
MSKHPPRSPSKKPKVRRPKGALRALRKPAQSDDLKKPAAATDLHKTYQPRRTYSWD